MFNGEHDSRGRVVTDRRALVAWAKFELPTQKGGVQSPRNDVGRVENVDVGVGRGHLASCEPWCSLGVRVWRGRVVEGGALRM